jgi:hypothetical protein
LGPRVWWLVVTIVWGLISGARVEARQVEAVAEARRLMREAAAAYEAGDYARFLDQSQRAAALRPHHPGLVYNVAAGHARLGQEADALAWLARYAAMGLVARPEEDPDFSGLLHTSGFADVLQALQRNGEPVGAPREAFRLPDSLFIPEGIAYDPQARRFFVGSVRQRRIVRVDAWGEVSDFVAAGQDGLWSVLGLQVDAARRLLWVCSAAIEQTEGVAASEIGRSGVWAYDLDRGTLVGRYLLPPGDDRHVLGDLAVDLASGDVFVTDAAAGALFVIRAGAASLATLLEPGMLSSPQGLCWTGSGALLVADYALGLVTVDVKERLVAPVAVPPDQTMLGIAGLACTGDTLVAVQNGVRPHRILQMRFDGQEHRLTRVETLAANDPRFDEPTLVVADGSRFYFVANSQWGALDADGTWRPGVAPKRPLVLWVKLE